MSDGFVCPFSQPQVCNDIPTVEFNSGWMGSTQYIDEMTSGDGVFTNTSVVKFIDCFGRSAIAFTYYLNCLPNHNILDSSDKYTVVMFQRYTGIESWLFGGHSAHKQTPEKGAITDMDWIEKLLSSGESTVKWSSCDKEGDTFAQYTLQSLEIPSQRLSMMSYSKLS